MLALKWNIIIFLFFILMRTSSAQDEKKKISTRLKELIRTLESEGKISKKNDENYDAHLIASTVLAMCSNQNDLDYVNKCGVFWHERSISSYDPLKLIKFEDMRKKLSMGTNNLFIGPGYLPPIAVWIETPIALNKDKIKNVFKRFGMQCNQDDGIDGNPGDKALCFYSPDYPIHSIPLPVYPLIMENKFNLSLDKIKTRRRFIPDTIFHVFHTEQLTFSNTDRYSIQYEPSMSERIYLFGKGLPEGLYTDLYRTGNNDFYLIIDLSKKLVYLYILTYGQPDILRDGISNVDGWKLYRNSFATEAEFESFLRRESNGYFNGVPLKKIGIEQ